MKVVVVSIDALIYEDLEYLAVMNNMKGYLSEAHVCKKVVPIYPTFTYPCHVSIMTGCYADKTGVYHNCSFPERRWLWENSFVKVPTIFDVAKKAGLGTAAVCWPVTGGADIDFLVPEAWGETESDDPDPVFKRLCSEKGYKYFSRHKGQLDWMRTPGMDLFASACFCDIMRENDVDLAFVHFSYLDHQRHKNGYESKNNLEALKFIDERMGEVFSVLNEDTEVMILGDHGQRDFSSFFCLQNAVDGLGFCGSIKIHPASFSAQVYLDGIGEEDALGVLMRIKADYPGVIEHIFPKAEAAGKYHLEGGFSFVVEACDGVNFTDDSSLGLFHPSGSSHAAHGYLPEKGPFPPLCMKHKRLIDPWCRSVDIAPTVMSLFSLPMCCDGRALEMA